MAPELPRQEQTSTVKKSAAARQSQFELKNCRQVVRFRRSGDGSIPLAVSRLRTLVGEMRWPQFPDLALDTVVSPERVLERHAHNESTEQQDHRWRPGPRRAL